MSSNTEVVGHMSKKPMPKQNNSNLPAELRAVIDRLPLWGEIPPPLDPRRDRRAGLDIGSGDQGTDG